ACWIKYTLLNLRNDKSLYVEEAEFNKKPTKIDVSYAIFIPNMGFMYDFLEPYLAIAEEEKNQQHLNTIRNTALWLECLLYLYSRSKDEIRYFIAWKHPGGNGAPKVLNFLV